MPAPARPRTLGLLIATVLLIAANSSSAFGAVTLGETGNPPTTCGMGDNIVQTAVQGPPDYAVPTGYGVITSWSFQGSGTGKLIVMRPVTAPDQFIFVGKSQAETLNNTMVVTYPTQIPVQPGDVIGMRMDTLGSTCFVNGAVGDATRYDNTAGDPADGSPQTLGSTLSGFRIAVAATLEADCDHDGLGDETQDPDTSSCNPLAGPSPLAGPTGQRAAAKKHCKKKFRHDRRKRKRCLRKAKRLPA